MKKWETPRLIVLVRNKPEETVLMACKDASQSGPEVNDIGCDRSDTNYGGDCTGASCSNLEVS